jgi:hypothetical protein
MDENIILDWKEANAELYSKFKHDRLFDAAVNALVNRHAMEVEEIGLPVALHILGTIGSDTRSLVVVLARKHHDDWYVAGLNAEPQAKITIQPMGGVILK